jgi:hypothetical protein
MRMKVLVSLCLVTLLSASAAFAQKRIRADVPFAFTVSGKQLPAGEYRFIRSNDGRSIAVVGMNKMSAIAMAQIGSAASSQTRLKDATVGFRKVGDQYYLSKMMIPGMAEIEVQIAGRVHEHQGMDMPVY